MKINDTISVNPGKEALGQTGKESIFRASVINRETDKASISAVSFVLPTTKSGSAEFTKYSVPLRALFASILILAGLMCVTNAVNTGYGVCSLIFGGLLAIGAFTRPVMIGAAAYYAVISALSIRAGGADLFSLSLMFGCMIFSVFGSGKYSCDFLLRKAIRRNKIKAEKRRSQNALSYKAYRCAKF